MTPFHEFHAETVDMSLDTPNDGKEEIRYHPDTEDDR